MFDATDFVVTIPFGKFRGVPLPEVTDTDYLNWILTTGEREPDSRVGYFVEQHAAAIAARIAAVNRADAQAFVVDYTLNESQAFAVEEIVEDLLHGDDNVMRLDGGAGYGKSFALMEVVRRAKLSDYEVNACATSYVASQVLDLQLSRIGTAGKTIASLCRLDKVEQEDRDAYTVTEQTTERMAHLLGPGKLLIIDEWSMVGDDVANTALECARECGGKLLLVGDSYQLPPVNQRTPSAFADVPNVVTLTEPMRFPDTSDLFTLEQIARYNPRGVFNSGWVSSDEVTLHEDEASLFEQFVTDYRAHPEQDGRVVYYRRADVADANETIRHRLFGAAARGSPVIEDERLMVMSTTDVGRDKLTGEQGVRYYSGQTFLVEAIALATPEVFPCYMVKFHDHHSYVPVILPGDTLGAAEYRDELSRLRGAALVNGDWRQWRRFRDTFLPVGYNYAMTVHRCQGQTVDRVYFDPLRLQGPEGAQLTYVASTRAARAVHMVKPS